LAGDCRGRGFRYTVASKMLQQLTVRDAAAGTHGVVLPPPPNSPALTNSVSSHSLCLSVLSLISNVNPVMIH